MPNQECLRGCMHPIQQIVPTPNGSQEPQTSTNQPHSNTHTHSQNLSSFIPVPLRSPLLRLPPHHPHKTIVSAHFPNPPSSYSTSDADLSSRGFHLRRTPDGLNLAHLNSVFASVGFPKRDPDKIRTALDHTDCLLWVEYEKTRRPVAFARATGDGVFNAIIWDVVVDPSFQGIGLGKAVMERVVGELLGKGIRNIALYSEPRVLGFYRPLGFVADPDGIRGMVYSRKQQQKKK